MNLNEADLPSLVLLGTPALMVPQPPVAVGAIATEDFQRRLVTLKACMHHYGGIGIAAPQIGWSARVFCLGIEQQSARYPQADAIPFSYWINPEIVERDRRTNWAWEGCLSVPGMRGWVERPETIQVRGLDEQGISREQHLTGFAARVFQHEYDHLDGVLFPMRVAEPRWLLPDAVMAQQLEWQPGWPSQGACDTPSGVLSSRA